jgi:hypothetical protein
MTESEYDVYTLGFSSRTWDLTSQILKSFRIERLHLLEELINHPVAEADRLHTKSLVGTCFAQDDSVVGSRCR